MKPTNGGQKIVDYYIYDKMGVFISDSKGRQMDIDFADDYYVITIYFDNSSSKIDIPRKHYLSEITSPGIVSRLADTELQYYCVMLEKGFFEEQYRLYAKELPVFNKKQFAICADIIKTINTFAFECEKNMKNKNITLGAQTTLIAHWIIRSALGEEMDMRSVSSDFSIAKVQYYIEQYYGDSITSSTLASYVHLSQSTFNRLFSKELGVPPMKYLEEVRLVKAKILLKRADISLTDVAVECGFGSGAHFATIFKKYENMSPSEYRKKHLEL